MTAKKMLPLVAVASFGLGIAADRALFRSDRGGEQPIGEEPDGPLPTAMPGANDDPPAGLEAEWRESQSGPVHEAIAQLDRDGQVDFHAMVEVFGSLPPGEPREHLLHRLAERWARTDPEEALVWAATLRGPEREHATDVIFHVWSEEAPADAIAYAAALPNSERSLRQVHHLSHLWADRDPAAAIAWGLGQGDAAVRARVLRGATEAWAGDDPAAAAEFALGSENTFDRRELLGIVAHRWAENDWGEALEWAGGLGEADRGSALRAVLHRVAEESPAEAAELFGSVAHQLAGYARRDAAGEVAARWSESSPTDAARWALGLPEEDRLRRRAVHEVVQHWLHLDSLAASEWVGTLPAGETRDAAAGTLVEHVARNDPESAFAWASSIGEEGHRTHLMHHSLERWNELDPAAARAAFDTASLNADQRRHLGELFDPDSTPATSP